MSELLDLARAYTDMQPVWQAPFDGQRPATIWKGLCPLHEEHTASFIVSIEREQYLCVGCQASGDVTSLRQRLWEKMKDA